MSVKRLFNRISSFSLKKLSSFLHEYSTSLFLKKRFAFLVFVVIFSIAVLIWQGFIGIQRSSLQNLVNMDLRLVRSKLDSHFENKLNRLELLAEKISRKGIDGLDLNAYGMMGFDFIAFVDKDFVINKINRKDTSGLLGQNLALEATDRYRLMQLRKENKKTISSKLHIHGKGKEIDFFVPVMASNGLILASVKLKNLMDYMLSDFSKKLNLKIYDEDAILYQNSQALIDTNDKPFHWSLDYDSVYSSLSLPVSPYETIRVIASPSRGVINSVNIFSDKYILFLGFLFSVLFAFALYYVSTARIVSEMFESLIEKLDKQMLENNSLKRSLIKISKTTEEQINTSAEVFRFNKASAYKVMQEAIKSKKEQEDIGKVIRRNSNRLKLSLESAGIGTWTWDIQEDHIIWDDFTHKIFGVSPDRSIASYKNFLEKVSNEDRSRLDSEIQKTFNDGGKLSCSFRVKCPGGHEKQVSLKAKVFLGIDAEPIHMTGVVQDLSYETNNSALLNSFFALPIALFCVADLKGNFKILNSAWSDMLGYSISELKANPFMYFVHPKDRDKTQIEYQLLMGEDGYKTINFANRYRCKNGVYKHLMWNATKIRGDNLIYAIAWERNDKTVDFSGAVDDEYLYSN